VSKEATKIVGAILFAILVVTAIRLIGNGLFERKEMAPPPEQAEEAAPAPAVPTEAAAPAEKPAEKPPEEAAAPAPEAAPAPAAEEAAPAPAPTEVAAPGAGDPAAGEKVFKAHLCFGCHRLEPGQNAAGPSLAGVYGKKAGTVPGFAYSDALKNSGIVWNDETLNRWVEGPKAVVEGTKMVLAKPVTDAKDRADLIAFLKTHSGG
jgi:cytochrome c2